MTTVTKLNVSKIADGADNSWLGCSVSLNNTGTIALFGAFAENNYSGAVYVYTKQNETWTPTAVLETGIKKSYFGLAIHLSRDGKTAIIGAPEENNSTGAVYIYKNYNNIWTQVTSIVGQISKGQFGRSVNLNSDGTIAIIGSYGDSSCTGAAFIYSIQDSNWTLLAQMTGEVPSGNFGNVVRLSGDGKTAFIGAYAEKYMTGAVYVYKNQNGVWTQTKRISTEIAHSQFGSSISLNDDGTVALIGASAESDNTGAAYIYTNQNGDWVQTARLASRVVKTRFAWSVSLNDIGNIALIAPFIEENKVGTAYLFSNQDGVWIQSSKIENEIIDGSFGVSVSLNSDGTIALIGACGENKLAGAIYIAE